MSRPRVAVEGIPSPRPVCQTCGKPLRYFTDDTRAAFSAPVTRRVFRGWNAYYARWCTTKCAGRFALAAHLAGYRLKR